MDQTGHKLHTLLLSSTLNEKGRVFQRKTRVKREKRKKYKRDREKEEILERERESNKLTSVCLREIGMSLS